MCREGERRGRQGSGYNDPPGKPEWRHYRCSKSDRLRGGPEQDFVDVDVVGLVYSERDRAGEGVRADGDLADEFSCSRLNVSVLTAPGEMTVVRIS